MTIKEALREILTASTIAYTTRKKDIVINSPISNIKGYFLLPTEDKKQVFVPNICYNIYKETIDNSGYIPSDGYTAAYPLEIEQTAIIEEYKGLTTLLKKCFTKDSRNSVRKVKYKDSYLYIRQGIIMDDHFNILLLTGRDVLIENHRVYPLSKTICISPLALDGCSEISKGIIRNILPVYSSLSGSSLGQISNLIIRIQDCQHMFKFVDVPNNLKIDQNICHQILKESIIK